MNVSGVEWYIKDDGMLPEKVMDIPLTLTTHSIRTSAVKLVDPENIGIAVGISLLSCMHFRLPVTGRHL